MATHHSRIASPHSATVVRSDAPTQAALRVLGLSAATLALLLGLIPLIA